MNFLVAFSCLVAVALALPIEQPENSFTLTEHRDVDGSYTFTYAAADSSKTESRDAEGNISGAYQYIDADGVLQKAQYLGGAQGIQIIASNLPVGSTEPVQDTPEVLKATEDHLHEVQRALKLIARAAAFEAEYKRKHPELAAEEVHSAHVFHQEVPAVGPAHHVVQHLPESSPVAVDDEAEVAHARAEHLAEVARITAEHFAAVAAAPPLQEE